jgi:hypothetical protein
MNVADKQRKKLEDMGYKTSITHICCYSGGYSSGNVALLVADYAKKYPEDIVILLNHDINGNVEDMDIKRFKNDVSNAVNTPITYANIDNIKNHEDIPDQFDVSIEKKGFGFNGNILCTTHLKTEPFAKYLKTHHPTKKTKELSGGRGRPKNIIIPRDDIVIYYGFDLDETTRIQRRIGALSSMGYRTDYPLALWNGANIDMAKTLGIKPPLTYTDIKGTSSLSIDFKDITNNGIELGAWKHANCIGCLKAGKQHWYAVYCVRPDIWEKAKLTEEKIGATIKSECSMLELEPQFEHMKKAGVPPTENMKSGAFWSKAKEAMESFTDFENSRDKAEKLNNLLFGTKGEKPCECTI